MTRFVFLAIGVLLIAALQYSYWYGDSGYLASSALEDAIEREQRLNDRLEQRNRVLAAEVKALKSGLEAVEARARTDLGMVVEGETFYLVVDEDAVRPGSARAARVRGGGGGRAGPHPRRRAGGGRAT
ncbi:MAG: hypothetical protein F4X36_12450, partial [Gammaproteobacteria bacterium]|nr:hypothetical protein [Gammaproteobacteria bacterium]